MGQNSHSLREEVLTHDEEAPFHAKESPLSSLDKALTHHGTELSILTEWGFDSSRQSSNLLRNRVFTRFTLHVTRVFTPHVTRVFARYMRELSLTT